MRLDQLCSAFGGDDDKGLLQGLRVLESGTFMPRPLATVHLADFGSGVELPGLTQQFAEPF